MPIEPKIAARIAKEHGLTLPDARAIASMAEDEDDATELAGTFSDDGMEDPRAMADRLLGGF